MPNVWCKVSGVATAAGDEFWTPDRVRPYVDHVLDNIRNLWADASNLFSSGMPVEASRRAEEARAKAQELAQKVNAKLE